MGDGKTLFNPVLVQLTGGNIQIYFVSPGINDGKVITSLKVNKNERRTVLPKKVRKLLDVDNVNHKYLIIHTERFDKKEYAILKRLDINKILGEP